MNLSGEMGTPREKQVITYRLVLPGTTVGGKVGTLHWWEAGLVLTS